MCNTQEQIARSMFLRNVVKERKYMKPCTTLENVRWEYVEAPRKPRNDSMAYYGFWFGILYRLQTYKQITQVR